MIRVRHRGLKSTFGKWCVVLGTLGVALYPIVLSPMINSKKYREIQKESRKGIVQEDIQPGNMKVWSDPFNRESRKRKPEEVAQSS